MTLLRTILILNLCLSPAFVFMQPAYAQSMGRQWHLIYPTNTLQSVTFGDGRFVSVGLAGTILTSSDGTKWQSDESGTLVALNGVAYGNGQFVAVGDDGTILTSTNGFYWTTVNSRTTHDLFSIAYGDHRFVIGGAGTILASTDGVNWSPSPDNPNWRKQASSGALVNFLTITFGGGHFVAGASNALDAILVSTDGLSWTQAPLPPPVIATSVIYGGGRFIAVVGNRNIVTSSNGISWTKTFSVPTSAITTIFYGAYGMEEFLVFSYHQNFTSANGVKWTTEKTGLAMEPNSAAYGNGRFVAVGKGGAIYSSTDGTSWKLETPWIHYNLNEVSYGGGFWVAVGTDGTILTSPDGSTWVAASSGTNNNLSAVAYGSGRFVVVGADGTILTSTDGGNWVAEKSGTQASLVAVTHTGNRFMAIGAGNIVLASSDGLTWSIERPAASSFGGIVGAAYGNGAFEVLTCASGIDVPGAPDGAFPSYYIPDHWYVVVDRAGQAPQIVKPKVPPWGCGANIIYAKGVFIVVPQAGDGEAYTSTDGVSWAGQRLELVAVTYDGSKLAAIGQRMSTSNGESHLIYNMYTSSDGRSWTKREQLNYALPLLPPTQSINGMAYGSGHFVVVGNGGTILVSSPITGDVVLTVGSTLARAGSQNENLPVAPINKNGRVYVPLRFVSEALGAQVSWNATTRSVTISQNGHTVEMTEGETTYKVNGQSRGMDAAPFVAGAGYTMVPVGIVGQALGYQVNWEGTSHQVVIARKAE